MNVPCLSINTIRESEHICGLFKGFQEEMFLEKLSQTIKVAISNLQYIN